MKLKLGVLKAASTVVNLDGDLVSLLADLLAVLMDAWSVET